MAKSCKKGMASNRRRSGSEGHRFKTRCQQGLFAVASPLIKCTLPLVICIHNISSCVRCIGWLYICFTCDRCDMSSINKRSNRQPLIIKKFAKDSVAASFVPSRDLYFKECRSFHTSAENLEGIRSNYDPLPFNWFLVFESHSWMWIRFVSLLKEEPSKFSWSNLK